METRHGRHHKAGHRSATGHRVVAGNIEYHELRTLTIEDCKFGGVFPIHTMGDRGVEIKHTLNRLHLEREGEQLVASLNLMLQNRGDSIQII